MVTRTRRLKSANLAAASPALPHGRSLRHFLPLSPLERKLLSSCAKGLAEMRGMDCPAAPDDANLVRADFLRFLLLGGDQDNPVHERGLILSGAWIEGELDLDSARLPTGFVLVECHFSRMPIFRDATIEGSVYIKSCVLPGLNAERLEVQGLLSLNGSRINGHVKLNGAHIGGALHCEDVKGTDEFMLLAARIGADVDFESAELTGVDDSLSMDRAIIDGNLRLNGFVSNGTIRLPGAHIHKNVYFGGAKIVGKGECAVTAENAVVHGDVFFNEGCHTVGAVRLAGLKVNGDLILRAAHFEATDGYALIAEGITVEQLFALKEMKVPLSNATFAHAMLGRINDDHDSWGNAIFLHGLVYKSFAGPAATDAKTRLAWLDKQPPSYSGKLRDGYFKPQPWRHLRRVLQESGHFEDAREVGIAYERRLRAAGLIGQSAPGRSWLPKALNWASANLAHKLFGILIGYGYRPAWLLGWIVTVWLLCGAFYWYAALEGVMAPSNPIVFQHPKYKDCAKDSDGGWYLCQALPEEYTGFSPLAYSMDVLLPFVDIQQETDWAPRVPTPKGDWREELSAHSLKHGVRFVLWCEIIFGWVAGVLLVAVVSGLTKRTED